MGNSMLAIVPFGDGSACTQPPVSPLKGGHEKWSACARDVGDAVPYRVPAKASEARPYGGGAERGESVQDAMYLRLLEEKAKNRVMGVQLECASALLRVREERAAQKKRVRKAALKLLGWFGFGLCWGVCAMACWYFAPKWTCIAPAVLMGLAWRKAGGEV